MDLATVKARVKAWEKSFRGEHKREPTKDDIKNDGGDIGKGTRVMSLISSEPVCSVSKVVEDANQGQVIQDFE